MLYFDHIRYSSFLLLFTGDVKAAGELQGALQIPDTRLSVQGIFNAHSGMVPTRTGEPEEMGEHFPVREFC